jgi:Flp pilus assembly protein TadG
MGLKKNDEGAAAVEFALLLVPLILIIGGIVDFGLTLFADVTVSNAAHEGARLSAIDPDADIETRVAETATGLTDLTVTNPSCGEVTVSHTVSTFFLPIIGIDTITVTGKGKEACYS